MTASRALLPARRRDGRTGPRAGLACAAAGVGIVLVAVLAGSLTDPSSANAEIPVLGPAVKAIGGVGHAILHPLDTVVEGFVKILQAIFGGIEARLITGVINALLTIPNFDNGHVASLESTTVAIAAGPIAARGALRPFKPCRGWRARSDSSFSGAVFLTPLLRSPGCSTKRCWAAAACSTTWRCCSTRRSSSAPARSR